MSLPRLTRNDFLAVIVGAIGIGAAGCGPGRGDTAGPELTKECTKTSPCKDRSGVRYYEGSACCPPAEGALCTRSLNDGYFWDTVSLPPDFRKTGCVCGGANATGGRSRTNHYVAIMQECGLIDRGRVIGAGSLAVATSHPNGAQKEYLERMRLCFQNYVDRANDGQ